MFVNTIKLVYSSAELVCKIRWLWFHKLLQSFLYGTWKQSSYYLHLTTNQILVIFIIIICNFKYSYYLLFTIILY
jgi:hypothetical protein